MKSPPIVPIALIKPKCWSIRYVIHSLPDSLVLNLVVVDCNDGPHLFENGVVVVATVVECILEANYWRERWRPMILFCRTQYGMELWLWDNETIRVDTSPASKHSTNMPFQARLGGKDDDLTVALSCWRSAVVPKWRGRRRQSSSPMLLHSNNIMDKTVDPSVCIYSTPAR